MPHVLRHPAATMIAISLCAAPNSYAQLPEAPCDGETESTCDSSSTGQPAGGFSPWWIGGVVALAAVAAGGGGGGGGSAPVNPGVEGGDPNPGGGSPNPGKPSDPGDPGNPGNPGDGGPPPVQGGEYGDGHTLVGNGDSAHWGNDVETRIIGNTSNGGDLALTAGRLAVRGLGRLTNHGNLNILEGAGLAMQDDGSFDNHGLLHIEGRLNLAGNARATNHEGANLVVLQDAVVHMEGRADLTNLGFIRLDSQDGRHEGAKMMLYGQSTLNNGSSVEGPFGTLEMASSSIQLFEQASFNNYGHLRSGGSHSENALIYAAPTLFGDRVTTHQAFNNFGYIQSLSQAGVIKLVAYDHASAAVNHRGAHIEVTSFSPAPIMTAEGPQAILFNQGAITVTGPDAVAMHGTHGATVINAGTINLGTSTGMNGHGMVAMQSDGSATLNNSATGIINIYSDYSFAFKMAAGEGRLINNGRVNLYNLTSGIYFDDATEKADEKGDDLAWRPSISGYTVGTNPDGSAGQMMLGQGGHLDDVTVDTGFTRGTAASQVRLAGVFTGVDSGEANIKSATVVWRAQAERDNDGKVDVVMTRNDYRALADAPLQGVANALEAGYDNNALYHSLEVADATEFNRALAQLSGAEVIASTMRLAANGDAFWSSLARSAPAAGHRMVAFGPGAQARHGVQGVGSGMQVAMPLRSGGQLQLSTGLLSSDFSSDGGQTRSQSRFAGVGYAQSLGAFELQHMIGNEWHQMDGQRQLNWGSTRHNAHSQRALSRTRIGSMLSREVIAAGLHWQPRLGAHAYHSREAGFHEYGADALGLSVGAGTRRGVQWEVGTAMNSRLGQRWTLRGDAALIGSLAYRASDRTAQLYGARMQAFQLPGVTPSALDYRVMLGADYRQQRLNLGASLMAQRLLGTPDLQAQLHASYVF